MKKLFKKLNNKTIRSVVFGLILAFTMSAGTSMVSAVFEVNHIEAVAVPLIGPSTSLLSRIGSLTVGSSISAPWIAFESKCIKRSLGTHTETCLDVSGGGTFAHLVVEQTAHILGIAVVSQSGTYGSGGGRSQEGISPAFLIEDSPRGDDSMLIQGLGRTNGGGNFSPQDYTTEREVCAQTSGRLTICSG